MKTRSFSLRFILPPSSLLLRLPQANGQFVVGGGGEELGESLPEGGVLPVGREFGEGREDEAAKVETRVRQDEKFGCLLYTSPSPRDRTRSRMPSSA